MFLKLTKDETSYSLSLIAFKATEDNNDKCHKMSQNDNYISSYLLDSIQ